MFENFLARLRGELTLKQLVKRGLKLGKNPCIQKRVIIDDSHAWLIEIGDNVQIASNTHILAHDGSTQHYCGYTKLGRVTIGNNVFIGSSCVILPGVTIGDNSIIGSNSVVSRDVPANVMAIGSPAKPICGIEEYKQKIEEQMKTARIYDKSYTLRGGITEAKKQEQKEDLKSKIGYII